MTPLEIKFNISTNKRHHSELLFKMQDIVTNINRLKEQAALEMDLITYQAMPSTERLTNILTEADHWRTELRKKITKLAKMGYKIQVTAHTITIVRLCVSATSEASRLQRLRDALNTYSIMGTFRPCDVRSRERTFDNLIKEMERHTQALLSAHTNTLQEILKLIKEKLT